MAGRRKLSLNLAQEPNIYTRPNTGLRGLAAELIASDPTASLPNGNAAVLAFH